MTVRSFLISVVLMSGSISPSLMAQTIWTKHPTPVLSRSSTFPDWKGLATGDACVIIDNDTLKMWYSGVGWLTATDDCPHVRIGYGWSLDGKTWNEYAGNPVLGINSDTSKFDADGVETPTVIKDPAAPLNQRYKLWYAGRKTKCQPVNDHKLGYAYSPDGINWTKYNGNPVLLPGNSSSWFNTFISSPSVISDNGIYKMWFTAPDLVLNSQPTDGKGNIGYATSTDGVNWIVHPSPVLIAGAQFNWDSASIAEPSVVKVGNTYHMFYSALDRWAIENFQVGYATSTDGVNWTKSTQNPVLRIGGSGKWDRYWASHPTVLYNSLDRKFKMWYTGRDTGTINSLTGFYWEIGYAESSFSPGTPDDTRKPHIYPNPASTVLNIGIPASAQSKIVISNCLGQVVYTALNKTSVDVTHFSDGVYFITVYLEKEKFTEKFIKQ